jgi:hypothetical protein
MRFDARPLKFKQYCIVVVVLCGLVLDELDIQLLAFVTAIILKEWAIEKSAVRPCFAASLVGMAFGSFSPNGKDFQRASAR